MLNKLQVSIYNHMQNFEMHRLQEEKEAQRSSFIFSEGQELRAIFQFTDCSTDMTPLEMM